MKEPTRDITPETLQSLWSILAGDVSESGRDPLELSQIAAAVSTATGKNFIIDPRVRARATMISPTPMSPAAFYEAFLSILQVEGFVAVPSGDVVTILPRVNARPRGQSNGAPAVTTAALGVQTLTVP
jgi:general secretion pathway protein D